MSARVVCCAGYECTFTISVVMHVAIVSDSVAENCLLYVNQSPDTMTNLQLLLFHRSCSQVRKRKFQLDLLEAVLR